MMPGRWGVAVDEISAHELSKGPHLQKYQFSLIKIWFSKEATICVFFFSKIIAQVIIILFLWLRLFRCGHGWLRIISLRRPDPGSRGSCSCVSVCACLCACSVVCATWQMCVWWPHVNICVHIGRLMQKVLCHSPVVLGRKGLSLSWKCKLWARLAGQGTPGSNSSTLLWWGQEGRHMPPCLALKGCWRSELRSSGLQSKLPYPPNHLPSALSWSPSQDFNVHIKIRVARAGFKLSTQLRLKSGSSNLLLLRARLAAIRQVSYPVSIVGQINGNVEKPNCSIMYSL